MKQICFISLFLILVLLAGCRTHLDLIETGDLNRAEISGEELYEMVPDYRDELLTLSGNGRALISQPGNSDRATLEFHSNREASLVTFRNRIGIEGGQILISGDSVLVYNRIDKIAEQISLKDANLTQIGTLATINLLHLFHYPVHEPFTDPVYQDEQYFVGLSGDGSRITIDKQTGFIKDIQRPEGSEAPYSRISYEEYEQFDGFYLPRKITIFSMDGEIRVTFLTRQLQLNRSLPALEIDIPEEVPVQFL